MRQALFVFVTVAVTVLVLTAVSYTVARAAIRQQIRLRLQTAAEDRAEMLRMYVDQQHERAQLVASRTRLRQLLSERNRGQIEPDAFVQQSQRILKDALQNTRDFLEISITDLQGNVVATNNPRRLGDNLAPITISSAAVRHLTWANRWARTEGYLAQLTHPIRGQDDTTLGVLMIRLSLRSLAGLLTDPTGLEKTGEVIVGRREGDQIQFLFASPRDGRLTVPWTEAPSLAKAIAGKEGFDLNHFGGDSVLVVYRPVAFQPGERLWGMIAKIDAREAFAPMTSLRQFCGLSASPCCCRPWPPRMPWPAAVHADHAPGRLGRRAGPG